tara:strand:+ start:248 stop:664 length:417 start_codon:yes stop_codon:yes gene_type:complete
MPKYVSVKKGSLHYQRAIPRRFLVNSKAKFYYFPLGLKEGASNNQIIKAVAHASKSFELRCQMLESLSQESFPESEIDMLSMEIIRKFNARNGEYVYEKKLFKGVYKISIQIKKQLIEAHDSQNNFNKKPRMRVSGRV